MCITHAKQKRKNHRGCVIRPERPMFLLFYECHLSKMIRNFYAFFFYTTQPTRCLYDVRIKILNDLKRDVSWPLVWKRGKNKKKKSFQHSRALTQCLLWYFIRNMYVNQLRVYTKDLFIRPQVNRSPPFRKVCWETGLWVDRARNKFIKLSEIQTRDNLKG